jgi:hypothetical protein
MAFGGKMTGLPCLSIDRPIQRNLSHANMMPNWAGLSKVALNVRFTGFPRI